MNFVLFMEKYIRHQDTKMNFNKQFPFVPLWQFLPVYPGQDHISLKAAMLKYTATTCCLHGSLVILAFLKQNTQIGDVAFGQSLGLEIGIGFQGSYPVEQFPCGWFLFNVINFTQPVKC